jgi:tRNA-2-methylthio-N6-dimethylallyladenosine synthase
MARAYTFEQFSELHAGLKRCGVQRFSTDLIAGFPGETEADHEKNLAFLEANRFRFAQIFMYEPRPGTAAADMEQIPRETRARRTLS